jgi:LuxR family maltose regulon positive regulatory protein
MIGFRESPLVVAAILAGQGTPAALSEAALLLREIAAMLAATHNQLFRIEALVQLALLHACRNQPAEARTALGEAVALAQPGNVRRVFLDAGPALEPCLDQLAHEGSHGEFVAQLRAGKPRLPSPPSLPTQAAAVPARPPATAFVQPRHPDLIELLTNREMEVLQLLALRLTNKEIAQSLGISTETVKQHAMNIFRKLHVENRREAIVQARAMGFQLDTPPVL